MRGFLILFFILVATLALSAQRKQIRAKPEITSSDLKGWYLKVNPISLLDPITPTFQFGIENRVSQKIGVETSMGPAVKYQKDLKNTDSTFSKYYKLKAELKFYHAKNLLRYFSIESFYTHYKRSRFYQPFIRDGIEYQAEFAVINKSIPGVTIKYGILQTSRKTKKVNGEVSMGLGMRLRNTKIHDINSVDISGHFHEWIVWHEEEGIHLTPHFVLTIKLQFKL